MFAETRDKELAKYGIDFLPFSGTEPSSCIRGDQEYLLEFVLRWS